MSAEFGDSHLVLLKQTGEEGAIYVPTGPSILLGSDLKCHIRFNQEGIDSEAAKIYVDSTDGKVKLKNFSQNSIKIGNQEVPPGEKRMLQPNDTIVILDNVMRWDTKAERKRKMMSMTKSERKVKKNVARFKKRITIHRCQNEPIPEIPKKSEQQSSTASNTTPAKAVNKENNFPKTPQPDLNLSGTLVTSYLPPERRSTRKRKIPDKFSTPTGSFETPTRSVLAESNDNLIDLETSSVKKSMHVFDLLEGSQENIMATPSSPASKRNGNDKLLKSALMNSARKNIVAMTPQGLTFAKVLFAPQTPVSDTKQSCTPQNSPAGKQTPMRYPQKSDDSNEDSYCSAINVSSEIETTNNEKSTIVDDEEASQIIKNLSSALESYESPQKSDAAMDQSQVGHTSGDKSLKGEERSLATAQDEITANEPSTNADFEQVSGSSNDQVDNKCREIFNWIETKRSSLLQKVEEESAPSNPTEQIISSRYSNVTPNESMTNMEPYDATAPRISILQVQKVAKLGVSPTARLSVIGDTNLVENYSLNNAAKSMRSSRKRVGNAYAILHNLTMESIADSTVDTFNDANLNQSEVEEPTELLSLDHQANTSNNYICFENEQSQAPGEVGAVQDIFEISDDGENPNAQIDEEDLSSDEEESSEESEVEEKSPSAPMSRRFGLNEDDLEEGINPLDDSRTEEGFDTAEEAVGDVAARFEETGNEEHLEDIEIPETQALSDEIETIEISSEIYGSQPEQTASSPLTTAEDSKTVESLSNADETILNSQEEIKIDASHDAVIETSEALCSRSLEIEQNVHETIPNSTQPESSLSIIEVDFKTTDNLPINADELIPNSEEEIIDESCDPVIKTSEVGNQANESVAYDESFVSTSDVSCIHDTSDIEIPATQVDEVPETQDDYAFEENGDFVNSSGIVETIPVTVTDPVASEISLQENSAMFSETSFSRVELNINMSNTDLEDSPVASTNRETTDQPVAEEPKPVQVDEKEEENLRQDLANIAEKPEIGTKRAASMMPHEVTEQHVDQSDPCDAEEVQEAEMSSKHENDNQYIEEFIEPTPEEDFAKFKNGYDACLDELKNTGNFETPKSEAPHDESFSDDADLFENQVGITDSEIELAEKEASIVTAETSNLESTVEAEVSNTESEFKEDLANIADKPQVGSKRGASMIPHEISKTKSYRLTMLPHKADEEYLLQAAKQIKENQEDEEEQEEQEEAIQEEKVFEPESAAEDSNADEIEAWETEEISEGITDTAETSNLESTIGAEVSNTESEFKEDLANIADNPQVGSKRAASMIPHEISKTKSHRFTMLPQKADEEYLLQASKQIRKSQEDEEEQEEQEEQEEAIQEEKVFEPESAAEDSNADEIEAWETEEISEGTPVAAETSNLESTVEAEVSNTESEFKEDLANIADKPQVGSKRAASMIPHEISKTMSHRFTMLPQKADEEYLLQASKQMKENQENVEEQEEQEETIQEVDVEPESNAEASNPEKVEERKTEETSNESAETTEASQEPETPEPEPTPVVEEPCVSKFAYQTTPAEVDTGRRRGARVNYSQLAAGNTPKKTPIVAGTPRRGRSASIDSATPRQARATSADVTAPNVVASEKKPRRKRLLAEPIAEEPAASSEILNAIEIVESSDEVVEPIAEAPKASRAAKKKKTTKEPVVEASTAENQEAVEVEDKHEEIQETSKRGAARTKKSQKEPVAEAPSTEEQETVEVDDKADEVPETSKRGARRKRNVEEPVVDAISEISDVTGGVVEKLSRAVEVKPSRATHKKKVEPVAEETAKEEVSSRRRGARVNYTELASGSTKKQSESEPGPSKQRGQSVQPEIKPQSKIEDEKPSATEHKGRRKVKIAEPVELVVAELAVPEKKSRKKQEEVPVEPETPVESVVEIPKARKGRKAPIKSDSTAESESKSTKNENKSRKLSEKDESEVFGESSTPKVEKPAVAAKRARGKRGESESSTQKTEEHEVAEDPAPKRGRGKKTEPVPEQEPEESAPKRGRGKKAAPAVPEIPVATETTEEEPETAEEVKEPAARRGRGKKNELEVVVPQTESSRRGKRVQAEKETPETQKMIKEKKIAEKKSEKTQEQPSTSEPTSSRQRRGRTAEKTVEAEPEPVTKPPQKARGGKTKEVETLREKAQETETQPETETLPARKGRNKKVAFDSNSEKEAKAGEDKPSRKRKAAPETSEESERAEKTPEKKSRRGAATKTNESPAKVEPKKVRGKKPSQTEEPEQVGQLVEKPSKRGAVAASSKPARKRGVEPAPEVEPPTKRATRARK